MFCSDQCPAQTSQRDLGAYLISGHVEGMLYLRECPFQPAASRADDLPQRTEHLTQEVLHRGEETSTQLILHNKVSVHHYSINNTGLH